MPEQLMVFLLHNIIATSQTLECVLVIKVQENLNQNIRRTYNYFRIFWKNLGRNLVEKWMTLKRS